VIALTSVASTALLRGGTDPIVVIPLAIVMGTLFGLARPIIHF
jgi:hypothetical protein